MTKESNCQCHCLVQWTEISMLLIKKQTNFSYNLLTKVVQRNFSNDTIFSLSSGLPFIHLFLQIVEQKKNQYKFRILRTFLGVGKCGVAVIRVSGSQTQTAIESLTRTPTFNKSKSNNQNVERCIRPRYAHLRNFYHPRTNEVIDRGLLLWFPAPKSFTGEDCCEFQVHGGPAVVSAMYDALNTLESVRPANPGEFTKRAFWSSKLDLTEVEGLADLIHAETEVQRKQALLQASGSLSKLYAQWRAKIVRAIAHVEAYIDFAEDENIEPDTLVKTHGELRALINDMQDFVKDARRGQMRQYGVKMVILGEPNVGKSSFMNHICREPISIVANIAGTTRDIIEKSFNIAGYPVLIADTAGLRSHTNDSIELEGMSRATNYAKSADLVILMIDALKLRASDFDIDRCKGEYIKEIGLEKEHYILDKKTILIVNKIDLLEMDDVTSEKGSTEDLVWISCKKESGIGQAMQIIEKHLKAL